eukprot:CAMPEP_0194046794 /NCGR_PEP_ID=MMETSP0009_2-20130614/22312_1 /TAXON_ID=210454 /ORGANISM="Grammatophora oceanica, Strain CCMP 410" /LENGTH=151 /DNA_ID=CAMNT_0038692217 /DNA_START=93 /DNA_END=548 /DNA_ORIENTATION=-
MCAIKRSISEMTNSRPSIDPTDAVTNAVSDMSLKHATDTRLTTLARRGSSCELATVLLSLRGSSSATSFIRQRAPTAAVSDDESEEEEEVPRLIFVDHSVKHAPSPLRKRGRDETYANKVSLIPKSHKRQRLPAGRPLHAPPMLVNFLPRS